MQTFHCQYCGNPIYLDNVVCEHCGHTLGLLPDLLTLSALEPAGDGLWRALAPAAAGRLYRQCENYAVHQVCNWMEPADSGEAFCFACRFNRIIPNLARPENLARWARIEAGKRRLIFGLRTLGLPLPNQRDDPQQGLAFAFLSSLDVPPDDLPTTTGHNQGLITINLDEADPALRERTRLDLDERYRTLIGHFRHEIGHFYWDLLIRDQWPGSDAGPPSRLEAFRAHFGDEQNDYGESIAAYYRDGAPPDWQQRHISAYASAHPWEDWAETFAHYLHIVDTLETATNFSVQTERWLPDGQVQRAAPAPDLWQQPSFAPILEQWVALTFALNSLNRSMGIADLYPFVISPVVAEKLGFVHAIVQAVRTPPAITTGAVLGGADPNADPDADPGTAPESVPATVSESAPNAATSPAVAAARNDDPASPLGQQAAQGSTPAPETTAIDGRTIAPSPPRRRVFWFLRGRGRVNQPG